MRGKNVLVGALLLAAVSVTQARSEEDCPAGQDWWDYGREIQGGACADMGLNTNAGVCRPGQDYETLCDDRRGSRGQAQYKLCQGKKRCGDKDNKHDRDCQPARGYSAYDWDFDQCAPCPRGTRNDDGRGGCNR